MVSWRTGAACATAVSTLTLGGVIGAHPASADPRDGIPESCMHGLVICISQDDDTLRLIDHGITKIEMAVRFGAQRTPTRLGTYKVEWKDENHISKMFGSAMPYSMFFDGGQAVHYSSDFAARGYKGASHGCVNTRDLDATRQLFETVKIGTRVVVYTNDAEKQARVARAAQLEKEKEQQKQDRVSAQDQRDDDSWDSDGPDGPDDY